MNTALTLLIGGDISKLRAEMNKANGLIGGFQKQMLGVGKLMAGAFAAGKMIEFGKSVFNATAQFQKFEAVLTNTLGDNGAANAAIRQIADFAARTPYQVDELTQSFVKLANQGFVPTLRQMQSLGDLASAMGKSFDQLTEAIIDAQTGEFERLKEFGIRAQKQGDKVTFTFKGVKQQVDFTADSIRQYVLSLGDVTGVTGGMEAQSRTLGGGLSNLVDSWDQLTLSIGKAAESGGLFSKTLDLIASGVKGIKGLFDVGESKEELEATIAFFEKAVQRYDMEGNNQAWQMAVGALTAARKKLNDLIEGERKLAEIQNTKTTPATDKQTESVNALTDAWNRQYSIFRDKPFIPTDQIKNKSGSDFLFDSGGMIDTLQAFNNIHNGLMSINGDLQVSSNAWEIWWSGVQANSELAAAAMEKHREDTMLMADVATTLGESIGDAFGQMILGQENMAASLVRVAQQVIEMYLKMSIAAMIKAAIEDPSMPFPFGKIAVAAAGIGVVKSLFSGLSSNMSGGGSGTSGTPGRRPSEMSMQIGGVIKGNDLHIMNRRTEYRKSWTG